MKAFAAHEPMPLVQEVNRHCEDQEETLEIYSLTLSFDKNGVASMPVPNGFEREPDPYADLSFEKLERRALEVLEAERFRRFVKPISSQPARAEVRKG